MLSAGRERVRQRLQRVPLLWALIRRDVEARYRGSWLGLGWSVVAPLTMLAIYTLVFTRIMRARWAGPAGDDALGYPLMAYSGMIIHAFIAEIVSSAPMAIIRQGNYVKRVVFPLTLLPVVTVGSASLGLIVGLILLVIMNAGAGNGLHATMLALPLALLPTLLLGLGLAWLLSAVGTFVRDISHITGFAVTALFFASPILYPAEAVPAPLQSVLRLNPLAWGIESVRCVVTRGVLPNSLNWFAQLAVCLLFAWVSLGVYRRVQGSFADVL